MAKSIIVNCYSTPDDPGYQDRIAVFDDSLAKQLIYHDSCSHCPNPYQPRTEVTFEQVYGWLAPQVCTWECVSHHKWGKVLLINSGAEVFAMLPNSNHSGRKVLTEVFIHNGYSEEWRGSAGCITIPPAEWADFISKFAVGEKGDIAIVNCRTMRR